MRVSIINFIINLNISVAVTEAWRCQADRCWLLEVPDQLVGGAAAVSLNLCFRMISWILCISCVMQCELMRIAHWTFSEDMAQPLHFGTADTDMGRNITVGDPHHFQFSRIWIQEWWALQMLLSSLRFCLGARRPHSMMPESLTLLGAIRVLRFLTAYWGRTSYPEVWDKEITQVDFALGAEFGRWFVASLCQTVIKNEPHFWWGGWTHVQRTRVELGSQGQSHMRKLEDFRSTGSLFKQRWLPHELLMNRT